MDPHEAALNKLVNGDDCLHSLRTGCDLVRGHGGPCWSGRALDFLGLSARCGSVGAGEQCWRADRHRGEHEDRTGRTWRTRKP